MLKQIVLLGGGKGSFDAGRDQYSFEETYFIGIDRGAWRLLRLGLPLHLAVGDFDSLKKDERMQVETAAEEVLSLPQEKDDTDTEAALNIVAERWPHLPIHAYGLLGGRLDHMLSNLYLVMEERYQVLTGSWFFYHPDYQVEVLRPGEHDIQAECRYSYLSFACLTPVSGLTLENVKYPLVDKNVSHAYTYVSNEFLPGQPSMRCSFREGYVLAIQARD